MTTFLLFTALPIVLAVAAIIASWMISRRARSVAQWCVSAAVFAAIAWSLVILYRIFVLGAWPTYLPHIIIGVTLVIVIAQTFCFRRSRA
jgi:hypothetical protein